MFVSRRKHPDIHTQNMKFSIKVSEPYYVKESHGRPSFPNQSISLDIAGAFLLCVEPYARIFFHRGASMPPPEEIGARWREPGSCRSRESQTPRIISSFDPGVFLITRYGGVKKEAALNRALRNIMRAAMPEARMARVPCLCVAEAYQSLHVFRSGIRTHGPHPTTTPNRPPPPTSHVSRRYMYLYLAKPLTFSPPPTPFASWPASFSFPHLASLPGSPSARFNLNFTPTRPRKPH